MKRAAIKKKLKNKAKWLKSIRTPRWNRSSWWMSQGIKMSYGIFGNSLTIADDIYNVKREDLEAIYELYKNGIDLELAAKIHVTMISETAVKNILNLNPVTDHHTWSTINMGVSAADASKAIKKMGNAVSQVSMDIMYGAMK